MALPKDINKIIFKSIFMVIKRNTLPTMEQFLLMNIGSLKLKESSPADWQSFWSEIIANQIIQDCKTNLNIAINNFTYHWFDNEEKTMKDLSNYINENQLTL